MTTIKTTTTRRGDVWYYVDGKRIGYCDACFIQEKNLREEIGTLFTVREGFAGNKGAQAMLNANIFTEKIGDSEFSFFFDTANDALDALKKLAAHFPERLGTAYIMGDAKHFGNKRLATYAQGELETEIEDADDYAVTVDAQDAAVEAETEQAADVAEMQAEFDAAVADSEVDDWSTLTINGETIVFSHGKLYKIVAPAIKGEIFFNNGRKDFRFDGYGQRSATEFFKRLAEDADIKTQFAEIENFMRTHGAHKSSWKLAEHAPFVAKITPAVRSGNRQVETTFIGHFVTFTAAKKFVDEFKAFAGEMKFTAAIKRDSLFGEECYRRVWNGKEIATFAEDDDDTDVFSLLPEIGELNDTRSDIEKEFDEFAAEDTDRDDRFNRGERYAEKLTAKLRKFDATAEVTYDINEYDEDTYYLEFDGIYRTPFTLDGIESSFHELKRDIAEFAAETKESLREKTVELTRLKERLSEEQALAECTRDHLKISQTWMRAASKNSDNANFYAEQAEAIGATIEKLDERIADLTTQITAVKTELATVNKKTADFKHAA